ncbi:MAG: glutamate 5-kinase [Kiloniellales bacterium]
MSGRLDAARRLIVKVGTNLIMDQAKGRIRRAWLEALADDIAELRQAEKDVIVVSSGAMALGRRILGLERRTISMQARQAAAAAGQVRLSQIWREAIERHGLTMAQVLLTLEDSESRRRYLNARSTLISLLEFGAVPVVNDNDALASEVRFGDNDRLAGRLAQMVGADTLVLLSDVDGLYSGDPRRDPRARLIETLDAVTPEVEAMAGPAPKGVGSGGMRTKIAAAKVALSAGAAMVIAQGKGYHPLKALNEGGPGTWFRPTASPLTARKQWIASGLKPVGAVTVDAGALKALIKGRNLLPAGVSAVEGEFQRGDAVVLRGPDGAERGRALINYSADESRRIAGHKTSEIEALLGYARGNAIIHSDDLVLIEGSPAS